MYGKFPLSCRAAKCEQDPQQQAVALRRMHRWGERLRHMRRERTLWSAQERQYDYRCGGEWRPDKGRYGTSDIGAVACFLLYINCLGRDVPLGPYVVYLEWPGTSFYGRGFLLSTELHRTVQS